MSASDHPLVTKGKRGGKAIEPRAAAAIRYWPICPQGHGLSYVHSGKRGQWVCKTCRRTLHKTDKIPQRTDGLSRRVCMFCDKAPETLMLSVHPYKRSPVYTCASCAEIIAKALG